MAYRAPVWNLGEYALATARTVRVIHANKEKQYEVQISDIFSSMPSYSAKFHSSEI